MQLARRLCRRLVRAYTPISYVLTYLDGAKDPQNERLCGSECCGPYSEHEVDANVFANLGV